MKYNIAVNDKKFETQVSEISNGLARVIVNGKSYEVVLENYADVESGGSKAVKQIKMPASVVACPAAFKSDPSSPKAPVGSGTIVAQIPGLIITVKVNVGDRVAVGQTVAIMEAMKMENDVITNVAGTVKEIRVQKGSELATGDVIMIIG